MTHRRKPPPPDPDPIPFDGLVICTDHGRHRPLRIAGFDYDPAGNGRGASFSQTSRWDVIADLRQNAGLTLRFMCKICRRDVRLREENALAAVDALRQASGAAHVTLDISLLPC